MRKMSNRCRSTGCYPPPRLLPQKHGPITLVGIPYVNLIHRAHAFHRNNYTQLLTGYISTHAFLPYRQFYTVTYRVHINTRMRIPYRQFNRVIYLINKTNYLSTNKIHFKYLASQATRPMPAVC